MKVIIAGSRELNDPTNVFDWFLDELRMDEIIFDEVVSGMASGADRRGEEWAIARNIPIKYFPADWKTYGKAAGPCRNQLMAEYADACIVFWDGKSRGSKDMIRKALDHNLKLFVYTIG